MAFNPVAAELNMYKWINNIIMIESRYGVKWISYPIPGTTWFPDGIELGGKAKVRVDQGYPPVTTELPQLSTC